MYTKGTGLTTRGLNGLFYPAFASVSPLYSMICDRIPSDGKEEIYRWPGENPVMAEWIGDRKMSALRDYGQTIQNVHYEATLKIDRDELDDDQTGGRLRQRVEDFARRAASFVDKRLTEMMVAGIGSTEGLAYDGQNFYDTDHSEGDSGTQSNDLTYAAATGVVPTQAEFQAAFWQAVATMAGFVDDRGEPWSFFQNADDINNIVCVIPPEMMEVASETVGAAAGELVANGKTNILRGRGQLVVNPRLTDASAFHTFYNGPGPRPFIFQDRQQVITEVKDDREFPYIAYMVDMRFAIGFGAWQKAIYTDFT